MSKSYLITGGLGFIGRSIALSLLQHNNKVIILDNNFRDKKISNLKDKNLRIYKVYIRKKN